jgi:acetyltransferase
MGLALLHNLLEGGYTGALYVISDQHETIDGVACHPTLDSLGRPVMLALIAVDAPAALDVVATCVRSRVPAAILYSQGFRTAEQVSAGYLSRLREIAAAGRLRLFGPHAFGIVQPYSRLNLTPSRIKLNRGNLALVSQSASVCANILDWSHGDGRGLSGVFVPGIAADIGLAEILDYLATDYRTECILLYLEGIADTRSFLSAVRAAASVKPVIALKAGQVPLSAQVAEDHNGVEGGGDAAFDAALRRAGVLRVRSVGDMFSAARALTTRTMPRGGRLGIVTNGAGPAVMAIDEIVRHQLELADLSPTTLVRLSELPRDDWSRDNPVGIRYDADPHRYVTATTCCLADPNIDGLLVILAPNDCVDPLAVAEALVAAHAHSEKPVLACWLGENSVRAARIAFCAANFPVFRTPENAVVAYAYMVNWVRNQVLLRETPAALSSYVAPDRQAACTIIDRALLGGRRWLGQRETKSVLEAFHIPVSPTLLAATPGEAMQAAQRIGYPVTMKVEMDRTVPADMGRMRRHLRSAPEVTLAWRELTASEMPSSVLIEPDVTRPLGRWLAIAIHVDPLFGPVITLSESGIASEVYDARALALPPLNPRLVDELLSVPYVARLLGPLRGMPAVAARPLRDILLRVSELASELPWLRHLEISALVADDRDALVVDATIDLQDAEHDPTRYRHMAICPYPAQLVKVIQLRNGSEVMLRPIRPEDASPLQTFVRGLSTHSKRLRYFSTVSELPQHALAHATQIDYGRQLTLVAVREGNDTEVLGEAEYTTLPDGLTCDFAIIVADTMAGQGLGKILMRNLIDAAQRQGLKTVRGDVAASNEPMLGLMESLGFLTMLTDDPETVEVILRLG